MSPETEAIIERLKQEGDLLRNSGTNSIKEVNVQLTKFSSVFEGMTKGFDSLREITSEQRNIAAQDAKLRALSEEERKAYYEKEADLQQKAQNRAEREEELKQRELTEREKETQRRKRNDNFFYKKMDGFFGGIKKFFGMVGKVLLFGAPLLYEFAVGYLNEAFGLSLPTIAEGAAKMGDFLKNTDWTAVGETMKNLALLGAAVIAFRVAMVAATAAMAAGRFLGGLGRRGTPPIVNPGPGGRTPPRATPPPARNFTLDADGNPVGRNGRPLTGAARDTALRIAAEDAATGRQPGFFARQLQRLRAPGGLAKGAGFLGGGVAAAQVMGLFDEKNLSADALESELLAQANRGSVLEQAGDVLTDTAISTAVGGGTGALFAGVGAIPGAISGALWGFGTSISKKFVDAFKDRGERGIDTLPNILEDALRTEAGLNVEEMGAAEYIDALKDTQDVAKKFIADNTAELNALNDEVTSLEAIRDAGANQGGFFQVNGQSVTQARLERMIEESKEERDLLKSQIDASQQVVTRRETAIQQNQAALDAYNQQLIDAEELAKNDQTEMQSLMQQLAESGWSQNGITQIFNSQGGTNLFQNTSMSKNSASNVTSYAMGYGGGNGGLFVAVPGLISN